MSSLTSLEAYDLLRFSEVLEDRLAQAEVAQLSRKGMEREKAWLSEALVLLRAARLPVPSVLERARDLPELAEVREDYAVEMQDAWVDVLERLHAGITFHAGSRAPVLEALFPHQKFPALRKLSPEGVRAYAAELDRRTRLGYVKRIFGQPEFAFVLPLVLEVPEALRRWEACFAPSTMTEEQAAPIREELAEVAYRVERVARQARLLAEAALLPVPGAFEESGVGLKPRRRVGTVPTEAPPTDEGAIVDDGVPLAEALGLTPAGGPAEEQAPEERSSAPAAGATLPEAMEAAVAAEPPLADPLPSPAGASAGETGVVEGAVAEAAPAVAAEPASSPGEADPAGPAPTRSRRPRKRRAEQPPSSGN